MFPSANDPGYVACGFVDGVPANITELHDRPDTVPRRARIGLRWHAASQHTRIDNYQPASYYRDYLMTNSHSRAMQSLQRSQMDRLLSLHDTATGPRSFVEVGCGDGSFMQYARGKVDRILGIEPSGRFAAEARQAGFDVIGGYVAADAPITEERFDAFAARQVFEHLADPADVLRGIIAMLNPGAVGLIEVPNGHRSLRRGRYYDFFPDHVNYYSVNSLVALASDAHLNVVACNEAFGGDYLELWVRWEPATARMFAQISETRERVGRGLLEAVGALTARGLSVGLWGAGGKALCILAGCAAELASKVLCIIDSDPHKHGRYVPGTRLQVLSPDQAAQRQVDAIVVLALSFREEIVRAIRATIPSCSVVLTIDDRGQVVAI